MKIIWIRNFCQSDSGASAAEYSIIVSLIAMAVVGAVTAFGSSVLGLFVRGNGIFS